jgi:hypothetical protein
MGPARSTIETPTRPISFPAPTESAVGNSRGGVVVGVACPVSELLCYCVSRRAATRYTATLCAESSWMPTRLTPSSTCRGPYKVMRSAIDQGQLEVLFTHITVEELPRETTF